MYGVNHLNKMKMSFCQFKMIQYPRLPFTVKEIKTNGNTCEYKLTGIYYFNLNKLNLMPDTDIAVVYTYI